MKKREKEQKSNWFDYEAYFTPLFCAELIERNDPLQKNLLKVFSHLLQEFLLLINKREGVQLFFNQYKDEVHYTFQEFGDEEPDKYFQKKDGNLKTSFEELGLKDLKNYKNQLKIPKINGNLLKSFLEKIGVKTSVDIENEEALILPFNFRELNLGIFVIWGERNPKKKHKPSEDIILGWISSWYHYLSKYFKREFRMDERTYIPSYYTVGWKPVAVLFADIRNFTPLTEILRNRYYHDEDKTDIKGGNIPVKNSKNGLQKGSTNKSIILRTIINDFCSKMSEIIQNENLGRIDKFIGDEIMVIFGEQDETPSKIVCNAIYIAIKMVNEFKNLKNKWQEMAFGKEYEFEFNETVEIDMGIGIDFGKVFFEYLGDKAHREYTAVGDHVNFASRLQGMAAREDEETGEKRPNIIISRTAFKCSKPWLRKKDHEKLKLRLKGKSYQYDCYGIEPENFNDLHYSTSQRNNDWGIRIEK